MDWQIVIGIISVIVAVIGIIVSVKHQKQIKEKFPSGNKVTNRVKGNQNTIFTNIENRDE